MLTTLEDLSIAAFTAGITWFVLKRMSRRGISIAQAPRRRDGGIMVNASERTPAQIAYDADVRRTVTCVHLQPIERGIRAAGLHVHKFDPVGYGALIRAECRINEPALREALAVDACVSYRELYRPELSDREEPEAGFYCSECLHDTGRRFDVLVSHPFDGSNAPWFPSAPQSG